MYTAVGTLALIPAHVCTSSRCLLREVKTWVSKCLPMKFMMGGASVSIVTTDSHMILLSYYELLKNRKIQIRLTCVYYPSPASVLEVLSLYATIRSLLLFECRFYPTAKIDGHGRCFVM